MRRAVKLYRRTEILDATGITRHTFRMYEEVGLVGPSAREGRSPLYAEETIETVCRVERIRRDLGVNLAGVHVILEMRRTIEDLQTHLEEVVRFVQTDLKQELEQHLRRQEKALMRVPPRRPPAIPEE